MELPATRCGGSGFLGLKDWCCELSHQPEALAAARDAIATGFGGTLAGGTHHAFRAEGSGFCVFNDVAIAIHSLRPKRAAVVDLDVHQGDGSAHFFVDDPNV